MQELPRNQREFGDLGEHGGTGDSQGGFWDAGSSRGIREDFFGVHRDELSPEHSHGLALPGRRLRKLLPAPIAALHLLF